jgi:hypothetical protein
MVFISQETASFVVPTLKTSDLATFAYYVFNASLSSKVLGGEEILLNFKSDNNSVKGRPAVSKNLVSKGVLMHALSCQTSRRVTGSASCLARVQFKEKNGLACFVTDVLMLQGRL